MTACTEAPPPILATFEDALARLPDGYVDGNFGGRSWGVTVKRSEDGKRIWLYGEKLRGTDIVSFNLYRFGWTGGGTEAVRNVHRQGDRLRSGLRAEYQEGHVSTIMAEK